MPAYVQAPKRKLDSVDACSASTSSKHRKLSVKSTISTTLPSLPSTSSASASASASQPKPTVWGQRGSASKILFGTASKGTVNPLVAPAAQPKPATTAALSKSSAWGQPAKPIVAVPPAKTTTTAVKPVAPTTPIKVESTLHPSCSVLQPTPRKALNPSCQVFQPASPGENLIAFLQQVQPPRSISSASSGTSGSSSSKATSSTSWRSQSSATSVPSCSSQSSWRSGISCTAPASAPAQPRTTALQIGQICFLPAQANIAIGEPIHSHPDFANNSKAFQHPCVVVAEPDAKGYVTCFQMTSFGQYQGLLDKYSDKINQHGQTKSMAAQRMRWLLIDCGGVKPNHDNLPMMHYESGSDRMPKCTYVNCEKWFKVKPSHLVVQGRVRQLSRSSVQLAWNHHDGVLEKTYGAMSKALINFPYLMP
ncbi:hypothetical protein E6O75_ATG03429 [Venturia nashicola]|uniref:Uncharacterized protein n=1 Tax=Venturia nashicola TaxID=86259 RepID=A0A4Z1P4N8_9PEZI|nr:hypothetical protein E6O75_ATG03429 [Venturia nashicola]